uniref:Mitochondrial import inner membrane translocase subunit n=1 Tax=Seriola lalandi dorsalis TaxID=1841481 RepID=A0A3B4XKX9_SERLL
DVEPNEQQLKDLQGFMETEQQKAVIQAAINKLTETCFDKCVTKPGAKLDSSEASCISNCAGRYLDSSLRVRGILAHSSRAQLSPVRLLLM